MLMTRLFVRLAWTSIPGYAIGAYMRVTTAGRSRGPPNPAPWERSRSRAVALGKPGLAVTASPGPACEHSRGAMENSQFARNGGWLRDRRVLIGAVIVLIIAGLALGGSTVIAAD